MTTMQITKGYTVLWNLNLVSLPLTLVEKNMQISDDLHLQQSAYGDHQMHVACAQAYERAHFVSPPVEAGWPSGLGRWISMR